MQRRRIKTVESHAQTLVLQVYESVLPILLDVLPGRLGQAEQIRVRHAYHGRALLVTRNGRLRYRDKRRYLHGGYIHRSFTAAVQFGRSFKSLVSHSPFSGYARQVTVTDSATGSTASAPCGIADSMIHDVWWRSEGKPRIMHQSPRLGRPARASVLSMNPNRTRRVSSVAFLKSK